MKLELQHRPYQQDGINWLRTHQRGLLFDSPGLGKTPQAALAATTPVLVACPSYLVSQWYDWLTTYISDSVVTATGAQKHKRTEALKSGADWTIINYEMLRTHERTIFSRSKTTNAINGINFNWQTVVYDEAHHLRNRKAVKSKHAAKLAHYVPNVYLLTADPVYREVDDLWHLGHMLHPTLFSSYHEFVRHFCVTEDQYFGTKVLGVKKQMLPELELVLNTIGLGRTYEQIGRQLPELIEKIVLLDLPDDIRKLYKQIQDYYIAEIELGFSNWASVMHGLRQVTGFDGKLEVAEAVLEDNPHDSAIIFCWYRDIANNMAKRLGTTAITGETPMHERRHIAQRGGHVVATIGALSEGIDLSHARTVLFLEEHWPPGANNQALRRVHRERQDGTLDPVQAYYVMARNTIDTHIHKVAQSRGATIKDVVKGALGV